MGDARRFAAMPPEHAAVFALGTLGVFGALIWIPAFRGMDNLVNVLDQSAALAVLALGQGFVIAAGQIDLSVGQLLGLVTVVGCAITGESRDVAWASIAASLGLGTAVGLLNGVLVSRLRLHPLILTFGMLSVLQGAIFMITDRSIGQVSPQLAFLASGRVAGLPVSVVLVVLLAGAAQVLLQRTGFGWHLQAFGYSAEAARRAGIDPNAILLGAFALSGLSAGVAGLLIAGRLGTGYPHAGDGFELDAIVAVVLGGTRISGGRTSVWGTLAAVLVLSALSNVLNLLEVPAFTQMLVKGLVVIGAILTTRRAAAPG